MRASLGSIGFVLSVIAGCNSVAGIEPAAVRSDRSERDDDETTDTNASEATALPPPSTDGAPAPAPDAGPAKPPGPCDKYPNAKLCNGKCVYIDDPLFGCTPESCMPCIVPHASAVCSKTFECVVAQCADDDWADCDGKPANGCETDIDSPSNCGGCGVKCGSAAPYCVHGSCSATPRTN
jgi:hypothetical protein